MKTLTLLRHAKSSWDDATARDFDRPLNARGRRAARAIGGEMHRLGLGFGQVIASPAVRVVETLAEVEAGYGGRLGAAFDRRIYLASPDALLDLIHGCDKERATVLLAGHNPGLEGLALLLGQEGPLRVELALKYPTATLTEIQLPAQSWADVVAGSGTITRFIRPRDLDPELGPDEES